MSGEIAYTAIHVRQGDDVQLQATLTDPTKPLVAGKQQALDLTGRTVQLVTKASRDTPDTDPSFKSYTGSISSPSTAGICTFAVPATDTQTPAVTWYRIGVTSSGKTVTAVFGPWEVEPV
jgi:hypothetical protein